MSTPEADAVREFDLDDAYRQWKAEGSVPNDHPAIQLLRVERRDWIRKARAYRAEIEHLRAQLTPQHCVHLVEGEGEGRCCWCGSPEMGRGSCIEKAGPPHPFVHGHTIHRAICGDCRHSEADGNHPRTEVADQPDAPDDLESYTPMAPPSSAPGKMPS